MTYLVSVPEAIMPVLVDVKSVWIEMSSWRLYITKVCSESLQLTASSFFDLEMDIFAIDSLSP